MPKAIEYAFRVVHVDNIPQILKFGFVHSTSPHSDRDYIPIGDTSIIDVRKKRRMDKNICIGDYIPFYFGPRSPMLYVIQHGFNGVTQYDACDLVYCVVRIQDIIDSGFNCIYTDGHALNKDTKFYRAEDLPRIKQIIKYKDVYASQWTNEDDLDLKRRKEAELLLKDELPRQFIKGFVVYNKKASAKLLSFGVSSKEICINPGYYF